MGDWRVAWICVFSSRFPEPLAAFAFSNVFDIDRKLATSYGFGVGKWPTNLEGIFSWLLGSQMYPSRISRSVDSLEILVREEAKVEWESAPKVNAICMMVVTCMVDFMKRLPSTV